jgi:hypothetical protein
MRASSPQTGESLDATPFDADSLFPALFAHAGGITPWIEPEIPLASASEFNLSPQRIQPR